MKKFALILALLVVALLPSLAEAGFRRVLVPVRRDVIVVERAPVRFVPVRRVEFVPVDRRDFRFEFNRFNRFDRFDRFDRRGFELDLRFVR